MNGGDGYDDHAGKFISYNIRITRMKKERNVQKNEIGHESSNRSRIQRDCLSQWLRLLRSVERPETHSSLRKPKKRMARNTCSVRIGGDGANHRATGMRTFHQE